MAAQQFWVFVEGRPAPQGSKTHKGGGRMVESSPYLKQWRETVAWETKARLPDGWDACGPFAVTLGFRFARPKSHYGTGRNAAKLRAGAAHWHAQRPDADKLARAVLDAGTGIIWTDDSQVVSLAIEKRWADPGEVAGVLVTARRPHDVQLGGATLTKETE